MSVQTVLRTRPGASLAALLAVVSLALTACSDDSGDGKTNTAPETVKITITDDEISPRGERVKVPAGEPVTIEITADHEGALHVHSSPEQELAFTDGTVTRELTIERPGVVEVESHDPDLVILQLEVR